MFAYQPMPAVTILVRQTPDVTIDDDFVYVTDQPGGPIRAMPREIAIQLFGRFAEVLRQDRLGRGADILIFRQEFVERA